MREAGPPSDFALPLLSVFLATFLAAFLAVFLAVFFAADLCVVGLLANGIASVDVLATDHDLAAAARTLTVGLQ